MKFLIRPLRPDDAQAFREIWLESLCYYGEMLADFHDQESQKPSSHWVEQCTETMTRCWFGSFTEAGQLVGIQGIRLWEDSPDVPVALWWGNYAREEYRGIGAMRKLYETRLAWARMRACHHCVVYVLEGKKRPLQIILKLGAEKLYTRTRRYGNGPETVWHWYKVPLWMNDEDASSEEDITERRHSVAA